MLTGRLNEGREVANYLSCSCRAMTKHKFECTCEEIIVGSGAHEATAIGGVREDLSVTSNYKDSSISTNGRSCMCFCNGKSIDL